MVVDDERGIIMERQDRLRREQFARSKTEKRVFNQLKPFMGSVYMLQSGQNVESHIVGDSFPAYMASVERCGLFVFSNFFLK